MATFGLMGGAMQPQGHMQVFSRIVDYGQNPQAAIDGPRWRVHELDKTVWTEEHMPAATRERASRRAATSSRAPSGRASTSARARSSGASRGRPYLGASESRRDGAAVGFAESAHTPSSLGRLRASHGCRATHSALPQGRCAGRP